MSLMLNRRRLGAWAACGAAAAMAPCTASAAERGRDAVVLGVALEPVTLDPTRSPGAPIGEVMHLNVLEGLTKVHPGGSVSPLLAQDWDTSPDGLRYVFTLRPELRFHDGSVCDAAAVKANFDRAARPGSGNKLRAAVFDNFERVDAPEPLKLEIQLRHADGTLPFRLAESACVVVGAATLARPDANEPPVGTGPYRVESWQRGHALTLAAWRGWRDAAAVRMQRATFRFIAEPAAQVAALLAGDIDAMPRFDAVDALGRLRADARFQVALGATSGKGLMAFNHRRKPLDDLRVRRALCHAIDRQAFIAGVLGGLATPIGSHTAPNELGYVDLTGVYPYQPERARALLAEAGVHTPLELTLTLPPPAYARRGGEVIAAMLDKVGVRLKLAPVEWAVWLSGAFRGDFDLTLINHVEPLDFGKFGNPGYYPGYDSPALRELLRQHAEARRGEPQLKLYGAIQRKLAEDAACAWLFNPLQVVAARRGLKGLWVDAPLVVNDLSQLSWA